MRNLSFIFDFKSQHINWAWKRGENIKQITRCPGPREWKSGKRKTAELIETSLLQPSIAHIAKRGASGGNPSRCLIIDLLICLFSVFLKFLIFHALPLHSSTSRQACLLPTLHVELACVDSIICHPPPPSSTGRSFSFRRPHRWIKSINDGLERPRKSSKVF